MPYTHIIHIPGKSYIAPIHKFTQIHHTSTTNAIHHPTHNCSNPGHISGNLTVGHGIFHLHGSVNTSVSIHANIIYKSGGLKIGGSIKFD